MYHNHLSTMPGQTSDNSSIAICCFFVDVVLVVVVVVRRRHALGRRRWRRRPFFQQFHVGADARQGRRRLRNRFHELSQRTAKRLAGHRDAVPLAVHADVRAAARWTGRGRSLLLGRVVVGADERDAGAGGPVDDGFPQPRGHRQPTVVRQEQRLSAHQRLSVRARVRFQSPVRLKIRQRFIAFNIIMHSSRFIADIWIETDWIREANRLTASFSDFSYEITDFMKYKRKEQKSSPENDRRLFELVKQCDDLLVW